MMKGVPQHYCYPGLYQGGGCCPPRRGGAGHSPGPSPSNIPEKKTKCIQYDYKEINK